MALRGVGKHHLLSAPHGRTVHDNWALLTARRGLALDDPRTGRAFGNRSTLLLDSDRIFPQSRRELTSSVYSLRTDGLTGTGTDR